MNALTKPEDAAAIVAELGRRARAAAVALRNAATETKNRALSDAARRIRAEQAAILSANARDIEAAMAAGMSSALQDRLLLNDARVESMAKGLDEIATLPSAAQGELLGAIEAGADLRLVSATRGGANGLSGLRDDLRGRLDTVEIVLPTLAERDDDAVLLAQHFERLFSHRYGRPSKPLAAEAIQRLKDHPPAGGVRGLRQAVERAVVLGEGDTLSAADLAPPAVTAQGALASDLNLARSEKAIVEAALKRHAHNVSQAAKELGLTRAALYRRMVKHGL